MSIRLTKMESAVLKSLLMTDHKSGLFPLDFLQKQFPGEDAKALSNSLDALHKLGLTQVRYASNKAYSVQVLPEGKRYFEVKRDEQRGERRRVLIDLAKSVGVVIVTILLNQLIYITGLADKIKALFP